MGVKEREADTQHENEIRRLTVQLIAKDVKIRELEESLANCVLEGVKLRSALVYTRDHESLSPEGARVTDVALEDE